MKEMFDKIFNNGWAYFWFVLGCMFILSALIRSFMPDNSQAMALLAIGIACHGRAEVKILQARIETAERT